MVMKMLRWFLLSLCSWKISVPIHLTFHIILSQVSDRIFGKLGEMIVKHQRLKEYSRFLFIPGPDDAGPSTVLPRCALPKYITEELQKHIPNAIFASNPCRCWLVDGRTIARKIKTSCILLVHQIKDCEATWECPQCSCRIDNSYIMVICFTSTGNK